MDSLGGRPAEPAQIQPGGGGEIVNINAVELPGWLVSLARAAARLIRSNGAGTYTIRVIVPDRGDPAWVLAREDLLRRG